MQYTTNIYANIFLVVNPLKKESTINIKNGKSVLITVCGKRSAAINGEAYM
jgi:hypothetical protein